MTHPAEDRRVEGRRAAIACKRCRQSKLRCSGTYPCERCQKRSEECSFDGRDATSTRPSSSVADKSGPRKRAQQNGEQSTPKRRIPDGEHMVEALTPKSSRGHSLYLKNRQNNQTRRWLYLGASSTWSFNVRTASIIQSYLKVDSLDLSYQFSLDGDAYRVTWTRLDNAQQPDISRLPSFDYALYLINTVKYHLGGIFHVFDEDLFMQELRNFYTEELQRKPMYRLWYTQYLMLLAFGKSLLHSNRTSGLPSGTEYFTRAMAVLPETSALHEDPVIAIEVLCLISLYFHCLDMRQTAYSYIGQALRIALAEGMHTNIPQAEIGEDFAARCNNVWWTTYILDRMLSSTVGAPISVKDDDISNLLPKAAHSPTRLATLSLHVQLSRLISFVLTELYSANGSLESSYLAKTRVVLRSMAAIAEEMEQVIDIKFKTSLDTITQAATHLRLLYHQCIILATRPLLLCLLQEMTKANVGTVSRPNISPSVHDFIQSCAKSAVKTLRIMDALRSHNMLDFFLPFDLEYLCAASSIIIMVDDVLKCINIPKKTVKLGDQALDEIVLSGNAVAVLRRKELAGLRNLAEKFWQKDLSSGETVYRPQAETVSSSEELVPRTSNMQLAPTQIESRVTDNSYANDLTHTGAADSRHQSFVQQEEVLGQPRAVSGPISPSDNRYRFDDPQNQYYTGYDNIFDNDALMTFSTTSSQDLANNLGLARDEMLLLADQLDLDALSDRLYFDADVS